MTKMKEICIETLDENELWKRDPEKILNQLEAIENRCFPLDPWSRSALADSCFNSGVTVVLAIDSQMTKIVGYAVAYLTCGEGDIANVAVEPNMRRQGIGSALMRRLISAADKQGAEELFLEVRKSNSEAISLYDSLGFQKIGIRKKYYRKPVEDAVVMARNAKRKDA